MQRIDFELCDCFTKDIFRTKKRNGKKEVTGEITYSP